jgi:hypothetical protein
MPDFGDLAREAAPSAPPQEPPAQPDLGMPEGFFD